MARPRLLALPLSGSGDEAVTDIGSFPRRQALTRRFTLGEPRDIRVSDDGSRVAFLRSSGPVDPINALWILDVETGVERLVADPRHLGGSENSAAAGASDGDGGREGPDRRESRQPGLPDAAGGDDGAEIPAAERARRERVRESASGIVSYHADSSLTAAVFALDGRLWRAALGTGGGPPNLLASQPGAFDPRLSPDGRRVAYVAGPALRVTGAEGDRLVASEPAETVSWGSAEFVAAEEMGRTRGHWWSPDGRRLLAARVDTAPVPRWWISDPASPDAAPHEVRYPAAGEANATVGLAVLDAAGDATGRVDVAWNDGGWEYLAAVRWTGDGLLLTVQSRDQRTLGILEADPGSGACRLLRTITDGAWVELVPGVPRWGAGRLVTVEDRGPARRLCADGESLTGDDHQVRAVHHVGDEGVIVTVCTDPAEVHVARVHWDGPMEQLTAGPGVNGVAAGGDTTVIISRSLDYPGRRCTVRSPRLQAHQTLASVAASPGLELNVEIVELGSRRLTAAIVMPAGPAGRDGDRLPVLLDPYGGPHAQRVQRAEALFHTSQWFAEAGFAVLVIDGRGTPGRGPSFERAVRGDLAGPALEDQIEGLHAAAERWPRLDLSRVAIRGWSFGGYLAALAVMRRPDVFSAAVAGAPVADWRLYDTHYTERYLGHPGQEPANYERTDLTPLAARLRRPLLLIHGLADDNVVAAHTLRLSRALMEAGRPHTVLPLSGVTHMTPQEEVAENLLLIQLRFLQQALGMPPSR